MGNSSPRGQNSGSCYRVDYPETGKWDHLVARVRAYSTEEKIPELPSSPVTHTTEEPGPRCPSLPSAEDYPGHLHIQHVPQKWVLPLICSVSAILKNTLPPPHKPSPASIPSLSLPSILKRFSLYFFISHSWLFFFHFSTESALDKKHRSMFLNPVNALQSSSYL